MKKGNNNNTHIKEELDENIIQIQEEEINYIDESLIEENNFKVIFIQFINAVFLSFFNLIIGVSGSVYLLFVSYYDKFINNIYIFSRSLSFRERMKSFLKFSFFLILWSLISFFVIYFYDYIIQESWGNLFLGFAITFNLLSIPVFLKTLKPALPIYSLGRSMTHESEKDKRLNLLLFIGSIVTILLVGVIIRFVSSFNATLFLQGGKGLTFMPFKAAFNNTNSDKIIVYLLGGFVSGALFLIPGISFIIILSAFNINYDLFNAVRDLMIGDFNQLPIIIVIFMMFVCGLFSSTILVKYLNNKKPHLISSIGSGFMIASVPVILISLSNNDWNAMGSNYVPLIIGLVVGLVAAFTFYFINVRTGKIDSSIFKFLNPKIGA